MFNRSYIRKLSARLSIVAGTVASLILIPYISLSDPIEHTFTFNSVFTNLSAHYQPLSNQFAGFYSLHTSWLFTVFSILASLLVVWMTFSRMGQHPQIVNTGDEAMMRRQKRLQEVIDISLSGIMVFEAIWNAHGKVADFALTLLNPAAERITAYSKQDIGKRITEMLSNGRANVLFSQYVSVAETGIPLHLEHYSAERDQWFQLEVVKSTDGIIITFSDISARKTAEDKLRKSEALLRDSQELAHVGSYEWGIVQDKITWTDEHYRIFGYEIGSEITYQKVQERFHPNDRSRVNEAIERTLQNGELFDCEFRIVRPDNTERYIWSKASAFLDQEGNPHRLIGTVVDITERREAQKELYERNQELNQALEELKSAEEQLIELNNELEKRVAARTNELATSEEQLRETLANTIHLNEQLTEREIFLSSIIDQSPLSTWIADADGTQIRVNDACLRLFGIHDASVGLGKYNILQDNTLLNHPAYPDIQAVFSEGKVARFGIEYDLSKVNHLQVAESKRLSLVVTIFPIKNREGKVTHAVIQHEDITQHKQAEAALIASERRYRFMAESIPAIIWTADGNGDIDYFNHQWATFTGLQPEETSGWNWQPAVHPDDLQATIATWTTALQTGKEFRIEHRLKRHDGTYCWFRTRALPFRNESGEISKWFGTTIDFDEEKTALDQLAESKQHFQFLADFMPQLVWRTEPNGDHDYFNRRWYEYTGLTFEDTKDKGWSLVLHPDDYERTINVWQQSLETGAAYQIEYRFRRADGAYRWFLGRALPMKDEQGNIIKWFGTCTDIEDQRNTINELSAYQLELSKTNEELTRINVDLDNFIYTASHDLRAPIANLEGIANQMVKRIKGKLDESEQVLIDLAIISISKLKKTIQDLTEITKAQKEINSPVELVSFQQVLDDVQCDIRSMIEQSGVVITTQLAVDCIHYSPKNIRSILYNLLTNAIKYRSPDRLPKVSIKTQHEGEDVILEVSDNGLGIRKDQQHKLFTMFKRLHTHVEGTGIGLYIIKRIIENNKGEIRVESEEGQGTSFSIRFTNARC